MRRILDLNKSLSFRLILWVGLILLISFSVWSYIYINYLEKIAVEDAVRQAEQLGDTIRLGTKYAMMRNAGEEINQIISHITSQDLIRNIRIYNKKGEVKYSSDPEEIGMTVGIQSEACRICHHSDVPLETVPPRDRTRIFESPQGHRLLGIISPVYNKPGCDSGMCHAHPASEKVLGSLDIVVSLSETDTGFRSQEKGIIALAIAIFLLTSGLIGLFIIRSVNRPINELISGTRHIGNGEYDYKVDVIKNDEIGQLARAINNMGEQIGKKQDELNKQKDEYQALFENAPCYITVQDRDYRLLRYNRDFAEQFDPEEGQYCYEAYKGRSSRCEICPVSETFKDGKPHTSEESGVSRDGISSVWMVRTSPIMNSRGEVVAAMEMCLDLTLMRFLEDEARKSEEKYHTIFDTSPNPIFVLDADTLEILDCNKTTTKLYGYDKKEILDKSFLDMFEMKDRSKLARELKTSGNLTKIRQFRKDGETIYINIHTSSSEYMKREVLLVTTSDITDRLMAEQQLIQAGKMATLGEMSTGIAHELNQPLSVIKTACNFLLKKVRNKELIREDIMETLAEEMDSHVDRASRIINHMREFGRQSDIRKEKVQINLALQKALEIFSRQLELRGIDVSTDLQEDLPPVMADSNRLEQVFINLLTNARDAIEERWHGIHSEKAGRKISIKSRSDGRQVTVEVTDTGTGIPESIRGRIFDPFFTTKKTGTGTGLGLSISYGIIRDYDGAIKVESIENKGSTFILNFPV